MLSSKADKEVLWIENVGSASSYWPWNSSSFTVKLFLKKRFQKPLLGRVREVFTVVLSPEQAPGLPLPPRAGDRGAAHQREVSHRCTFHNRSPQRRKWTILCLNNVQGVIPTKPPPFFLGKCKVSCGLFTNLGEDEMSAVTEFPGFIPRTSPPYYYLQWHFGY